MHITSALELMASQHDEIEALLVEASAATGPSTRAAVISELADKLTLHLGVEQELLYPAADPLISAEVRTELAEEHQEIKRVLADLVWLETEDRRFARKLLSLQMLLQWHELWQETELFARLATNLPPPELEQLHVDVVHWFERTVLATAA